MPEGVRLSWQRTLIERAFAKDIAAARKEKDYKKADSIESDRRFEMEMHDEQEDAYLTKRMLSRSRRMRVPIPHRYNKDNTESDFWYEGRYTGGWYLTDHGLAFLRSQIREEQKARHEARAQWIPWLTALTGLAGAITGLVALLMGGAP